MVNPKTEMSTNHQMKKWWAKLGYTFL